MPWKMRILISVAFALLAIDPGQAVARLDGQPSIRISAKSVGGRLKVELEDVSDGPVSVEVVLIAPNGTRQPLAPLTGTARDGKAVLMGPALAPDDKWKTVKVRFRRDGVDVADSRTIE